MFKALKKNMWIGGFVVSKVFFPYQCSPNYFNFFVNFSILHKKGSIHSKHSKIKIHILLNFDTQTALTTIRILNL
jgi:hypothetical protein